MRDFDFRQELLRQARRLVFNKASDAAVLAFQRDGDALLADGLDLCAVSSIHRMANGSVELKFIDRIKLIELLLDAADDRRPSIDQDGFIQAIDRAASRFGPDARNEFAAGELDLQRERSAVDAGGVGSVGGAAAGADGGGGVVS